MESCPRLSGQWLELELYIDLPSVLLPVFLMTIIPRFHFRESSGNPALHPETHLPLSPSFGEANLPDC